MVRSRLILAESRPKNDKNLVLGLRAAGGTTGSPRICGHTLRGPRSRARPTKSRTVRPPQSRPSVGHLLAWRRIVLWVHKNDRKWTKKKRRMRPKKIRESGKKKQRIAPKNIREFPQKKCVKTRFFFLKNRCSGFQNSGFGDGCRPAGIVVECTAGGAFRSSLGLRNLKQRKSKIQIKNSRIPEKKKLRISPKKMWKLVEKKC